MLSIQAVRGLPRLRAPGIVLAWQWHQLGHMQTICTSLQTDNVPARHHSIFTGRMLFLPPNPQRQSTECTLSWLKSKNRKGIWCIVDLLHVLPSVL